AKADPAFEVKEGDEAAAIAMARAGKVRATIVLPPGFGDQARRALVAAADKPVVAVHYDPSQATAMTLVRGLLSQHVMKALGDSLGGEASGGTSAGVATDASGGAGAARPSAFSLPFTTEAVESTARTDRPYNGY